MVELPSQPLAEIDPEFQKLGLETGGMTFRLPHLSVRQKVLLCLANDICRGHSALALRLHMQAAMMHGIPFADVLALVRFIAPYAGYAASADALAYLGALRAQLDPDAAPAAAEPPTVDADDAADEAPKYGLTSDEWVAGFIDSRTARAWGENRLSAQERSCVALTADVANQTLGASFRYHVELALKNGVTPEQVRDVVRFSSEFGIVKAAAALESLEDVLSLEATPAATA
ncbi:hypothetical protein AQ490_23710 [Wenjunlia vitaminophila]|uniref:Carboxymuconolactone decarboxylase-like domain-containing protein n=1 Tax=Wenjunlia vitaminophila TaxID=76728 RepID=A0A0T6LSI5_WENVI|nr:carboxymuconolactone decarboxylase family protein [Wenjunlia vitaminophila]KRV48865.1 hypothetical protein AQ490_23710 [Wenjunlia vitaminophila]